jgi:hypothetical protein
MRAVATTKKSPEANSVLVSVAQKNIFNCLMNRSQLPEAFKPFGEMVFVDPPFRRERFESGIQA